MKGIKYVWLLILVFSLGGCKPPLPEGYPEHPGEAGKTTLEGIDSDFDGVRDDIKIEIFYAYPYEPVIRAALEQDAKVFNTILAAGAIEDVDQRKEEALKVRQSVAKDIECIFSYVYPDDHKSAKKLLDFMEREFVNTDLRNKAYVQYNQALSGGTYSDYEGKDACEFDLETGELLE